MRRNSTPALAIGAALALALLLADMVLTVASTRQLREVAGRVQHSDDVRMALQGVLALVTDAETAQRGFLITGQPRYLEPYRIGVNAVAEQARVLAGLLQAEPGQQEGLRELRRHVAARLGELDLLVAARQRSGASAAEEIMRLGAGEAEMSALRAVVARMAADEDKALAGREGAAARSYRQALVAGLATGLAAMLGVIGFAWLLRRSLLERDRGETVLAAEAEKLRTTLESIGDAVIATDLEGRITNMNTVAETLTGWRAADARGRPITEVFRILDETTRTEAESPVARAFRSGSAVGLARHTVLIRKDGSERPISDSTAPIRTAEGTVTGAVLVFRDVSERKQNEQALRDAEARLHRVLMEMAVPTMAFAEDGGVVLVNDAWVQGAGYRRDQLRSIADWADRAYPERGGFMRQHIASLFGLRERVNSGQRQVTTAAGELRVWHFFTAPIGRDAAGRRLLVTNAIDVTDRQRAEDKVQASDARLRFALESARLGHWDLDVAGGTIARTLRHDRIFGYEEAQPAWSFDRFLEHVMPEERAGVEASFRAALAGGTTWDCECSIRRPDGAVRRIWSRAALFREGTGGAGRWLGIVADTTDAPRPGG